MPKAALRSRHLSLRAQERARFGPQEQAALERNLLSLPAFSSARTLLFYASMRDEVPTLDLIVRLLAEGRRVALPITHPKERALTLSYLSSPGDLKPGPFGVSEPRRGKRVACPPSSIDVAIILGLAFDSHGHRLGYGMGYYDRFLPKLSCPLIGLCYNSQISDSPLPREAHDHPVNFVVSEKRVLACERPRE